ncbi:MAG TPA: NADH-quinone oxidoreductase subunit J [Bacteroidota bacterium]|nr:NADH-quinone oxidoreductase subunit J [Bacteroidota bacterium]
MNFYDSIFYLFAFITIVSGAVVVFSRNIIYSAFSLLFTFFGVAGIYVLLSADFLAVAQVLIYVGGILVLLLFGVMLTNKVVDVDMKTGTLQTLPASIIVAITAGSLCGVFYVTDWKISHNTPMYSTTTNAIGEMFMTTYILPFEIVSVVLLVALIGAAYIARKSKKSMTIRGN